MHQRIPYLPFNTFTPVTVAHTFFRELVLILWLSFFYASPRHVLMTVR